mmetsp:Transcript_13225/g.38594  ORF Transcript_13225/g.38594 Transcript_13225/m.38594 type:complete len:576 (+) Transcript_13225:802-2529(+)
MVRRHGAPWKWRCADILLAEPAAGEGTGDRLLTRLWLHARLWGQTVSNLCGGSVLLPFRGLEHAAALPGLTRTLITGRMLARCLLRPLPDKQDGVTGSEQCVRASAVKQGLHPGCWSIQTQGRRRGGLWARERVELNRWLPCVGCCNRGPATHLAEASRWQHRWLHCLLLRPASKHLPANGRRPRREGRVPDHGKRGHPAGHRNVKSQRLPRSVNTQEEGAWQRVRKADVPDLCCVAPQRRNSGDGFGTGVCGRCAAARLETECVDAPVLSTNSQPKWVRPRGITRGEAGTREFCLPCRQATPEDVMERRLSKDRQRGVLAPDCKPGRISAWRASRDCQACDAARRLETPIGQWPVCTGLEAPHPAIQSAGEDARLCWVGTQCCDLPAWLGQENAARLWLPVVGEVQQQQVRARGKHQLAEVPRRATHQGRLQLRVRSSVQPGELNVHGTLAVQEGTDPVRVSNKESISHGQDKRHTETLLLLHAADGPCALKEIHFPLCAACDKAVPRCPGHCDHYARRTICTERTSPSFNGCWVQAVGLPELQVARAECHKLRRPVSTPWRRHHAMDIAAFVS